MGNWQLDPFHTQVEFSAKHLGMMMSAYYLACRGVYDVTRWPDSGWGHCVRSSEGLG